jgi:ATP-dependent RNA helicase DDX49/DBP8
MEYVCRFVFQKVVYCDKTSLVALQRNQSAPYDDMSSFSDIGVADWLIRAVKEMGIHSPTPIQSQSIPAIMRGKSLLGIAQTGSGKTAAFALPVIQKLAADPYGVYCLVLTPTRELAVQIAEQITVFGKPIHARVSVLVGGLDTTQQALELAQKPHFIVATPGRLLWHLQNTHKFKLNKLAVLVLDEADRLLDDPGLSTDVSAILDLIPEAEARQTLLFSATSTPTLEALAEAGGYERAMVNVSHSLVETLSEYFLCVPQQVKDAYAYVALKRVLDSDPRATVLVFVATCRGCQSLYYTLRHLELDSVPLHSQLKQVQRTASLNKFRDGRVRVLLCTDVASRGLDIPTVTAVINYDVPPATADYVHRVGRTARAGRRGWALSLITQYDVERVHAIEERTGRKMEDYSPVEKVGIDDAAVEPEIPRVLEARKRAKLTMLDGGWEQKLDEFKERKKRMRQQSGREPSDVVPSAGKKARIES